jgi:hypothetical protein
VQDKSERDDAPGATVWRASAATAPRVASQQRSYIRTAPKPRQVRLQRHCHRLHAVTDPITHAHHLESIPLPLFPAGIEGTVTGFQDKLLRGRSPKGIELPSFPWYLPDKWKRQPSPYASAIAIPHPWRTGHPHQPGNTRPSDVGQRSACFGSPLPTGAEGWVRGNTGGYLQVPPSPRPCPWKGEGVPRDAPRGGVQSTGLHARRSAPSPALSIGTERSPATVCNGGTALHSFAHIHGRLQNDTPSKTFERMYYPSLP